VKFYHALVATITHRNDKLTETNKNEARCGAPLRLIKAFPVFLIEVFSTYSSGYTHAEGMKAFIADLMPRTYSRQSFGFSLQSHDVLKFPLKTERIQSTR